MYNKIRHSSRSSSNKRSKETPDQRCLLITISENVQETNRQTKRTSLLTIMSSSNQRSKETADQRCLLITISENGQETNRKKRKKY